MSDPVDPDFREFDDTAEGAIDGRPVASLDGSELIPGGED